LYSFEIFVFDLIEETSDTIMVGEYIYGFISKIYNGNLYIPLTEKMLIFDLEQKESREAEYGYFYSECISSHIYNDKWYAIFV
jgi:hypothetical protein